jgi:hypothetical protein
MRRPLSFALVVLATACLACSRTSPVTPTPTSPSTGPSLPTTLAGTWRGYLIATECFSATDCGEPRTVSFLLRVVQDGSGWRGTLELTQNAFAMAVVMDVVGTAQADGAVLFTGQRAPLPSDAYRVELARLVVHVDSGAGLSGEIDLSKFPQFNSPDRRLTGRVASATYEPLSTDGALSGTWTGHALVRVCSGYCPLYQDAGDEITFTIVLGQSGAAVTGRMSTSVVGCESCWLPVTGTVSGARVLLSSERIAPAGSGGRTVHLERFEGTLDALGRLAGQFVYEAQDQIAVKPFDVSSRLECEILWLARD